MVQRLAGSTKAIPFQPDKVGLLIAALISYAALALPFATLRANRIVQGESISLVNAMPSLAVTCLSVVLAACVAIAFFRTAARLRLLGALVGLSTLAYLIGLAAAHLTPDGNSYGRVSPASGFWLLLAGLIVMATDAIARLKPKPATRVILLVLVLLVTGIVLASGRWDDLSIIKEYGSRRDIFWTEAIRHLQLAFGSLLAAVAVGLPLGVLCYKINRLRAFVLNSLNIVQTIPSIALFGLLIAPLGWMAANIPGASEIGIRGIGMAPAFVALFLYSLLPIVSNTVVGLDGVSGSVREAARGLGMTAAQRLLKIDFPLALPIILTGIRIVLVQNIGLATIAALIGGGGFGVFVFQGIGQTAMDLVLLGTLPTVILGFTAAILLDALIDSLFLKRGRST